MRQTFWPGSMIPSPPLPFNASSHSMEPRNPLVTSLSSLGGPFQVGVTPEATKRMVEMYFPRRLVPFKRTRQVKASHRVSQRVTLASMHYRHLLLPPRLLLRVHSHRARVSKPMRVSEYSSPSGLACPRARILQTHMRTA